MNSRRGCGAVEVPIDDNRSITLAVRIGDVGVNVAVDGWFVGHLFSLSVTVSRRTGEENQKYMFEESEVKADRSAMEKSLRDTYLP